MSLFILEDLGGDPVFPDRVGSHLIEISNFDSGYGEQPDGMGLIQVTYARTESGAPPQRLDALVNTNFPEPPGNVDIIIAGVDQNFAIELPAGSGTFVSITAIAGIVLPRGDANNPTVTILAIYDTSQCNGSGYWVLDQNGDPTGFRSSVILYHELSHAHDFATQVATSEAAAQADENDMRTQVGDTLRHPTDHSGACGGGPTGCCVVASVASGSPYSAIVSSLRRTRDSLLRRTDVGFDFFERLHYQYYAFSPEVCRMMAASAGLTDLVARYVVEPLVRCLELVRLRGEKHLDADELGRAFEQGRMRSAVGAEFDENDLQALRSLRAGESVDAERNLSGRREFAVLTTVLKAELAEEPVVRWALLEPLVIYAEALEAYDRGASTGQIGTQLWTQFERWSAELPITEVWKRLPNSARAVEIDFLGRVLVIGQAARVRFASRLEAELGPDEGLAGVLSGAGFRAEEPM